MGDLDIADFLLEIIQLLLEGRVFFGHLLVLGFPLVSLVLEGLYLAFKVAGFYVSLAEPRGSKDG